MGEEGKEEEKAQVPPLTVDGKPQGSTASTATPVPHLTLIGPRVVPLEAMDNQGPVLR